MTGTTFSNGPPGTGKTPLITAIVSYLSRCVYRVWLVAPQLSDDSLLTAINRARAPALLVMEDIDALFNRQREKHDQFHVTYSGLLNAIDRVCDSRKLYIYDKCPPTVSIPLSVESDGWI